MSSKNKNVNWRFEAAAMKALLFANSALPRPKKWTAPLDWGKPKKLYDLF